MASFRRSRTCGTHCAPNLWLAVNAYAFLLPFSVLVGSPELILHMCTSRTLWSVHILQVCHLGAFSAIVVSFTPSLIAVFPLLSRHYKKINGYQRLARICHSVLHLQNARQGSRQTSQRCGDNPKWIYYQADGGTPRNITLSHFARILPCFIINFIDRLSFLQKLKLQMHDRLTVSARWVAILHIARCWALIATNHND